MEELRRRILEITEEIIKLTAERMRIAEEIGREKKRLGIEIRDRDAEERLISKCLERCRELGLSEDFCRKLLRLLIDEAIRVQGRSRRN